MDSLNSLFSCQKKKIIPSFIDVPIILFLQTLFYCTNTRQTDKSWRFVQISQTLNEKSDISVCYPRNFRLLKDTFSHHYIETSPTQSTKHNNNYNSENFPGHKSFRGDCAGLCKSSGGCKSRRDRQRGGRLGQVADLYKQCFLITARVMAAGWEYPSQHKGKTMVRGGKG